MSWSLFQLLTCIPIGRVITVRYVSSSHSLSFLTAVLMQVLVRYGAPISISATSPSFPKGDDCATTYFLDLSINPPNWNTARVARNTTLSGDEKGDEQTCIPTFFAAHVLILIFYCRLVNNFTTKFNLPTSLFNLNPSRSNTTPSYTTLQPHTPHSPPPSQHCHLFSTSFPTIISAAPPKNPSRSPHFVSQQGRKELSKA